MKKLIALLMAFVMLIGIMTLAGCDSGDPNGGNGGNGGPGGNTSDLYGMVTAAIQKTKGAKSYSAVAQQTMKENLMGNETEAAGNLTYKANLTDPAKPLVSVSGTAIMDGYEVPGEYYFDGEWMYYTMYNEGYKSQASMADFEQQAGSVGEVFAELPKELFNGISGTTDGGTTKVELTANSDTFKAMYTKLLVELFYDVLGEMIDPVTVDNVKIVISVANGYVKSYEVSFHANYTIGNDFISYDYSHSVTFESIDQEVTVTPPEGYENFMEMGWG